MRQLSDIVLNLGWCAKNEGNVVADVDVVLVLIVETSVHIHVHHHGCLCRRGPLLVERL